MRLPRSLRRLCYVLPVAIVYFYVTYAFFGAQEGSDGPRTPLDRVSREEDDTPNYLEAVAPDPFGAPVDDVEREIARDGADGMLKRNEGANKWKDEAPEEDDVAGDLAPVDANGDAAAADGNDGNAPMFGEVDCVGPYDGFPNCEDKMTWLRTNWRTHLCYEELGVDGTDCSFQEYLSYHEDYCPPPKGRPPPSASVKRPAVQQRSLAGLLIRLSQNPKMEWIIGRLRRMEPLWKRAVAEYGAKRTRQVSRRNVLLYMGFVSDAFGERIAENAFKGGPLGELVQWADTLASLWLLGHEVTVATETHELSGIVRGNTPCGGGSQSYDVVYIDIIGLRHFRNAAGSSYDSYRCKFRVLDSFGTEAQYNANFGVHSEWGGWNLNLRQFYTMFPHSPDNSFLGFVVEPPPRIVPFSAKKDMVLVYGKELDMWIGKRDLIDAFSKHFEIHATVGDTKADKVSRDVVPSYVINHGVVGGERLLELLADSKVFLGMGFPYEGPAPLEAIASGCVFVNARFSPPKSSANTPFFAGKPTRRELTSQHPYLEDFVGQPSVVTVNVDVPNDAVVMVQSALAKQPGPNHPLEFTPVGMLERVDAFVAHHQFCHENDPKWPPVSAFAKVVSRPGQSCKEACRLNAYICEPSFFPLVNVAEVARSGLGCNGAAVETRSLTAPHRHAMGAGCVLQQDPQLFSCVAKDESVTRLCPCRSFKPGQTALCPNC